MRNARLYHLALAVAIGVAAGLPVQLEADDTEIYLGSLHVSVGVRPNVLFILDTSGSMAGMDGMSQDRLDRMKDALHIILDDANNINVGLMRFTDPGGPILFPVSYIDEDVSVVEAAGGSGADINVQIDASNDDAEEIVTGDRSHPLETSVQNRLYAMRDYHVAPMVDGDPADPDDDDGLADGYTTVQGKTTTLAGDLFDVTTINDPSGADLTALQAAKGFHIDLNGTGEKGLAAPIVLAGTIYFTT